MRRVIEWQLIPRRPRRNGLASRENCSRLSNASLLSTWLRKIIYHSFQISLVSNQIILFETDRKKNIENFNPNLIFGLLLLEFEVIFKANVKSKNVKSKNSFRINYSPSSKLYSNFKCIPYSYSIFENIQYKGANQSW